MACARSCGSASGIQLSTQICLFRKCIFYGFVNYPNHDLECVKSRWGVFGIALATDNASYDHTAARAHKTSPGVAHATPRLTYLYPQSFFSNNRVLENGLLLGRWQRLLGRCQLCVCVIVCLLIIPAFLHFLQFSGVWASDRTPTSRLSRSHQRRCSCLSNTPLFGVPFRRP